VSGFSTLPQYQAANRARIARAMPITTLPFYHRFSRVAVLVVVPLLGMNARFKNSMTANNAEYRKAALKLKLAQQPTGTAKRSIFCVWLGLSCEKLPVPRSGLMSGKTTDNDVNFKVISRCRITKH